MAYQALYRRFRPMTFDHVMGQEHITTTLKNQINSNNISHAYLFSGTRGTGKTSTAKVFARAINCINNTDGNPCNECEACKGLLEETIMDVIEMDAASNTGVDDIRDLREKAKYPPSKCRYKVYIIDEVHMISKSAFNALLKTLEEPPKHLIFILATTEPQKLPATILSRCQRFDFKRISVKNIIKNMEVILEEIGVKAEEKGLNLIARNSDGAMRDALSLLDQCLSFSGDELTNNHVLSILGIVNNDIIYNIAESVIEKNTQKALELINDIDVNGKDINQFIKDLILHFRNLMVAKASNNLENIIDEPEEIIDRLKEQSNKIDINRIINILKILSDADAQCKWSSQPKIILEVSLIRMLNESSSLELRELMERVNTLEERLDKGNIDSNASLERQINKGAERRPIAPVENTSPDQDNQDTQTEASSDSMEIKDAANININMDTIIKEWNNILKAIKSERIALHALIMEGKPVGYKAGTLTIAFDEGFMFHKEAIDKTENKEIVEGIISKCLKANIKVKFIMSEDNLENNDDEQDKKLIQKVIDLFGEDLVEIEE